MEADTGNLQDSCVPLATVRAHGHMEDGALALRGGWQHSELPNKGKRLTSQQRCALTARRKLREWSALALRGS